VRSTIDPCESNTKTKTILSSFVHSLVAVPSSRRVLHLPSLPSSSSLSLSLFLQLTIGRHHNMPRRIIKKSEGPTLYKLFVDSYIKARPNEKRAVGFRVELGVTRATTKEIICLD
jgi:hypothetical protein